MYYLLFDQIVKAVEDALAQLADFLDLLAVLPQSEITCSQELHKESHIVPCKKEHEREGHEIAEGPPEAGKHPKKDYRNEKADRDRHEGTYRSMR